MQGVLVVNMGGPQSQQGMKQFLWHMFTDKHILPFIKPFRFFLASIITYARYKKSWAKYELIGGTPLMQSTNWIADSLRRNFPEAQVRVAYSYNNPFIEDELQAFARDGINDVKVISLYPHYSITTLQSVRDDVEAVAKRLGLQAEVALPYFSEPAFVRFWCNAIRKEVEKQDYRQPLLIFSGHSIPNFFLDKGDCYPKEIEESARLIANSLGMDYLVAYQSQIGKKWLGPVTEDVVEELARKGREEILLVPISFVNENLETLYDMDQVIIPKAKAVWGIEKIGRVCIPGDDPDFVEALCSTLRRERFYGRGLACDLCSGRFV